MTLGIIVNAKHPKAFRQIKHTWQQVLAEEMLTLNYLSDVGHVELVNNRLNCWKLFIDANKFVCSMKVEFRPNKKLISNLDILRDDTYELSKYVIISIFNISENVTAFVNSVKAVLESCNP